MLFIASVFVCQSTDSDERLQVTELLAKMFALKDSKLAFENKTLWFCFLQRYACCIVNIHVHVLHTARYIHYIYMYMQF